MKKRIMTILSILFIISFSNSCFFSSEQDNPNDPANIDFLTDEEAVSIDKLNTVITYGSSDTSESVTGNLVLPSTGENGTTITWLSSNTSVISNTGVVTRPIFPAGNTEVTFTALIVKNGINDTKTFMLTVIETPPTDAEVVAVDKSELEIQYNGSDNASSVTQNMTLPTAGMHGSTISWVSNSTNVTSYGIVYRPRLGNKSVILTATIKYNTASDTKSFSITLTEQPYVIGERGPGNGYVFYDKGYYSNDGNGYWRYLEVANVDQSTGIVWYNGYGVTGASGTAIGTGKTNTAAIISYWGEGTYAATICTAYRGGGLSDWFLPSYYELKKIYDNLGSKNIGGFATGTYHCSTEYNQSESYFGNLTDSGGMGSYYKTYTRNVRAIRAF